MSDFESGLAKAEANAVEFEIDDGAMYDILAQMSPSVVDAHGDDYLNVYGEYSLADLVTQWIHDCLGRPEAPAFDYSDLDVPAVVDYLEAVMPVYITALIAVVDSCDRLADQLAGEEEES